ncbi:MAG: RNA methyltransferase [Promethearchaeota archaeon]|jgi:TrmH family RNA methyltransferase
MYQKTQRVGDFKNIKFSIVLIRPKEVGNIGSVARVMRNFDFSDLFIFNPSESKQKIMSYYTHGFAMGGKDVLMNAKIIEIENQVNYLENFKMLLDQFDLVIATTAKGTSSGNIKRTAITPEELEIPLSPSTLKIGILFGRESRGLSNEEIRLTDIILRIPTGEEYPTMNLSHACGIVLYEIFKKITKVNIGSTKNPVVLASREDRQLLLNIIKNIIEKLKIRTHRKEKVHLAFKNILERSFISQKELSLVTGLFSKVNKNLEDLDLY